LDAIGSASYLGLDEGYALLAGDRKEQKDDGSRNKQSDRRSHEDLNEGEAPSRSVTSMYHNSHHLQLNSG
jgi:hypothetical protein